MRIFIDGFGLVGREITRQLLDIFDFEKSNLLINTYSSSENKHFVDWLTDENLKFFDQRYKDQTCIKQLEEFKPDLILSLYGRRIFPEGILSIASRGAVNLHPSLLPDYKGCFSAPWVIINGEDETGITFHEMDAGIDTGRILMQKKVKVYSDDTGYTLYHRLLQKFVMEFSGFFENYVNNRLNAWVPSQTGRYYNRELPYNGTIGCQWDEARVERFIRAMHFPSHRMALLPHSSGLKEIANLADWHKWRSK